MNKFTLCVIIGTLVSPAMIETLTSPAMSMQEDDYNVPQEDDYSVPQEDDYSVPQEDDHNISQVKKFLKNLSEVASLYKGYVILKSFEIFENKRYNFVIKISSINVNTSNNSIRVEVNCELNGKASNMKKIQQAIRQQTDDKNGEVEVTRVNQAISEKLILFKKELTGNPGQTLTQKEINSIKYSVSIPE